MILDAHLGHVLFLQVIGERYKRCRTYRINFSILEHVNSDVASSTIMVQWKIALNMKG